MEGHADLVVAPLVDLVGAVVVDGHPAAAVFAGRDHAGEIEVFEWVILGVFGQVVAGLVAGEPTGNGEGDQHAVVFEADVPVQAAGVVLLDDEASLFGVACS